MASKIGDDEHKIMFKSEDIQRNRLKFTDSSLAKMKLEFPSEEEESLARFLIARNGEVSKASPFLKESIEWRIHNKPVDEKKIYKEYKKGKIYLHGVDKTGHSLISKSLNSFNFMLLIIINILKSCMQL